ncbi:U3 small nucleolar RNA-associated protein 4 homolog [Malurus melanocephalus]|uniref:U3 small nucleolar RNA-associated protein 4 homolog n=1 Tax=Malurus melanocephalus TaxID=175006 RepID=UPI00254918A1|nr:U3 small nucleolar RNA-associated protein 4 homolog [Malurus melanocephalus]
MGEFEVHRVRFFGLVPAGVRCLACHPRGARLALARTDGTVEVYNFAANYFQEKVIPGHEERSVESLCWAAGERLFGAGLGGDITEFDLSRLSAARGTDGGGGPIWSMAANGSGEQLAIGCEDGSVKIFQVVPGGIQFERNLDRRKGRVLCLSWHPSDSPRFPTQRRLVSCARKARLLLFQFSQHLELWRLGSTEETGKDGEVLPLCRMPEHLVQLKSKGPEHIYCSCVSPCGTWLGYSTASRFHLYRVRCDGDGVSLRKVPKVPKLLPPAYQLQFSADSDSLFVASARGSVHVLQLLEPGGCKLLHTLRPPSGFPSPALQPLLFMDLLDENCLVVVERPIMDFKTQLPMPVQQKKFGT